MIVSIVLGGTGRELCGYQRSCFNQQESRDQLVDERERERKRKGTDG